MSHPGWDIDDVIVQSCQQGGDDPNIDVSPLSMAASQATNTQTQQQLTVANTGGGTLDWIIEEDVTMARPELPTGATTSTATSPAANWPARRGGQGWDGNPARLVR
ncbi:MAG: hypothetical protein R2844_03495 [Caldilineales bacterium]